MEVVQMWSNLEGPLSPSQRSLAQEVYSRNISGLQRAIQANQYPKHEGSLSILEAIVQSEYIPEYEAREFDVKSSELDPDRFPRRILKAQALDDFLSSCSLKCVKKLLKTNVDGCNYIKYRKSSIREAQFFTLFTSPDIISSFDTYIKSILLYHNVKNAIDELRMNENNKKHHFRV